MLSDEPNEITNFYSLNVTITSIGWEKEGESDNWTADPPKTVDLKKLMGDNATEIWNGHLASGNYTKVFIYTDNVVGILMGSDGISPGNNATVKLPSSKLQISKPFTISEEDGNSIVNFVFDITVIKAGNSEKYILKPQIAESGPDQPFNDVTPPGERRGKNNNGEADEAEQVRLEGTVTEIGANKSFEMEVDSEKWTVDFSAAKQIAGMPNGGLTTNLEVVVEGTVVGPTSISATVLQIKKPK